MQFYSKWYFDTESVYKSIIIIIIISESTKVY